MSFLIKSLSQNKIQEELSNIGFDKNYSDMYSQITQNQINIPLGALNHLSLGEFKKSISKFKDKLLLAPNFSKIFCVEVLLLS